MPTNRGLCVSIVPALAGTGCCRPSEPASPKTETCGANLLSNITMPPTGLHPSGLVVRQAKAEPLLLAMDVKAYMTSVRPCGPGLRIDAWGVFSPIESPAAIRTSEGVVRKYSAAYFISAGLIFLPRYSGVR